MFEFCSIKEFPEKFMHLPCINSKTNYIMKQHRNFFRLLLTGLMLLSSLLANAQVHTVKGTVTDETGAPVIGAGVLIQGTTTGTVTSMDGTYSIDVAPGQILEISCVGYRPQTVVPGDRAVVDIALEPDATVLEDVVVVAYGTQKKVTLTGAVSAVSAKDLEDIPVANTTTLLQGRMPGLVLTQNGAQAGNDTPEIRIRGIGTFNNNDPMVLIDGVEGTLSQISDIPAADIASISVLKDAASSAIYGVRAANGVILITTKRGGESRTKVTYNGSYTLQTPTVLPDFVDGYNWALMYNDAQRAQGSTGTLYDDVALQKLLDGSDPDRYANTDWLRAVMRNASMHQHNLSVSGGTKNTHYMASLTYSNQEGIMLNTGVEKIAFRTNLDTRYKRFFFGINLSGNRNNVTEPAVAPSGETSIMRYVSWFTRPTVPVQYSNGLYGYVDGTIADAEKVKNPIDEMNRGYRLNNYWRFNGKAFAGIDIIDGLKFQTSISYNFDYQAKKTYLDKNHARYDADGNELKAPGETNTLTDYHWRQLRWANENLLTYDKTFGKHTVGVLLGHSILGNQIYITEASKQGFPTETIFQLDGGTLNPTASGSLEEYSLQSFFGRVKYSYADRYLFEFTLRRDGSSRMPKNNRYATFPSVSAGWVFSEEPFMAKARNWFFGKVRASWGTLGNQEIGNYPYSVTLGADGNYYFDQSGNKQTGVVETSVANENIKWETTRTVNVGLDLGFLQNRITASFDWYDKKTYDILMQLAMPGIFLGTLSAPYQNVGAVRTRGWELTMNYQDHKGNWSWYAGFNLSHVKNTILTMGNLTESIGSNTINRVGEPINSYYGLKAIGLYRTDADLNRTNAEGKVVATQYGAAPALGDIMYEDFNNDGNIDDNDRQIIGNPFPDFTYGFNIGFSWKNLDVSTFWQGVAGIYRYSWETTSDIRGNFTDRWLDRWSTTNVDGSLPALGRSVNDKMSSFWLERSDYLRLKNLEVGYTFRQKGLDKAGISHIRVYLSGTNLLTFTKLKDWDPEKTSGDTRNDIHPNLRTYSIGVNIEF